MSPCQKKMKLIAPKRILCTVASILGDTQNARFLLVLEKRKNFKIWL